MTVQAKNTCSSQEILWKLSVVVGSPLVLRPSLRATTIRLPKSRSSCCNKTLVVDWGIKTVFTEFWVLPKVSVPATCKTIKEISMSSLWACYASSHLWETCASIPLGVTTYLVLYFSLSSCSLQALQEHTIWDALNGINVLTAFLLLPDFQFCSCDFRKMFNVSKMRVCFPIPVRILMLTMHLWNCLSWLMPVKLPVQEESLVWLNYMYTVIDYFTVDSILINSWRKTNFILLLFCRCHSLPAILQTG